MPIVSVIIPVYNEEKYLKECLKSVCQQTLKDIEIICVDDGSTDSSLKILNEIQKKDKRIIVISQENSGGGTARNFGMNYASGKYLSFLDSDDCFDITMLEKMVKAAEKDDVDVLICRADRFDTSTKIKEPMPWSIHEEWLPKKTPFASTEIKRNFFEAFVWWPWDKLFKKSYIDNLGIKFQNLRTTNDLFFVCAATLMAHKISFINDVLVHQRVGIRTSLSRTREKSWDNYYKALVELKQFMYKQGVYTRFKQDFINYCLDFSLWHLDTIVGHSFVLLYQALQQKWLQEFNILSHDEDYFYNKNNYERIDKLLNNSPEDYLFDKIYTLEERNKEITKKIQQLDYDFNAMKNSMSFKVGRYLTAWPRKIRDYLKK